MRFVSAALAVLLVADAAVAFVPGGAAPSVVVSSTHASTTASATTTTTTGLSATYKLGENDPNDTTVPYDAAARLAYTEWTRAYNKPYDADRYETFRANYEAITVANVRAARAARDDGSDEAPKKLDLNEFADMTAEEYMAMQKTGGSTMSLGTEAAETTAAEAKEEEAEADPTSTGDVLGKAVEVAAMQEDASSALAEAADALAEEEEVRSFVRSFVRLLTMYYFIVVVVEYWWLKLIGESWVSSIYVCRGGGMHRERGESPYIRYDITYMTYNLHESLPH